MKLLSRRNTLTNDLSMLAVVAVTGFATRQLLEWAWESQTDRPAPKNPAQSGVSWPESLLWGATAGLLAGLVQTTTRRYYSVKTNSDPDTVS
jgi:hypothetical protein